MCERSLDYFNDLFREDMVAEMITLPQAFYDRDPLVVAPAILGKILVRRLGKEILAGRIVEVEAYLSKDDSAAHGFRGLTKSNVALFQSAGHIYIHSMHRQHCLDIVTEAAGTPSSILIRALEPLTGIETMKKFRQKTELRDLMSGPGKLTQALQIDKNFNGLDVTGEKSLLSVKDDGFKPAKIVVRSRIGISKATEAEFRFYIQDNPYISKK